MFNFTWISNAQSMKKAFFLTAALLVALFQNLRAEGYKRPDFTPEPVCRLGDITPENVKVKGATQGFAIWKNTGFVFHDGGQCVVIDLKKRSYISTFMLPGNKSHCNNASFGKERYGKKTKFPLLYISECKGEHRCYVTDISETGAQTVQTIRYSGQDYTGSYDWFVDRKNGFIYTYGTCGKDKKIMKFRLPRLKDSDSNNEVILTKADALDAFTVKGIKIYQGSQIRGRYAYLGDGYAPYDRFFHVLDMKEKRLVASVNVNRLEHEPEGIDVKGKWMYMVMNVSKQPKNGGLYRFRIK